ncbi:hypothetical protein ACJX0J_034550, partial [Zea mays]
RLLPRVNIPFKKGNRSAVTENAIDVTASSQEAFLLRRFFELIMNFNIRVSLIFGFCQFNIQILLPIGHCYYQEVDRRYSDFAALLMIH